MSDEKIKRTRNSEDEVCLLRGVKDPKTGEIATYEKVELPANNNSKTYSKMEVERFIRSAPDLPDGVYRYARLGVAKSRAVETVPAQQVITVS